MAPKNSVKPKPQISILRRKFLRSQQQTNGSDFGLQQDWLKQDNEAPFFTANRAQYHVFISFHPPQTFFLTNENRHTKFSQAIIFLFVSILPFCVTQAELMDLEKNAYKWSFRQKIGWQPLTLRVNIHCFWIEPSSSIIIAARGEKNIFLSSHSHMLIGVAWTKFSN